MKRIAEHKTQVLPNIEKADDLAVREPEAFKALVEAAKATL
ncbi:MAG: hypothetical protein AAGF81_15270 [Pseudomonadota bacterium]